MDVSIPFRAQITAARTLLRLPPEALVRIAGGAPVARDGCVLDAQTQVLLWAARRLGRASWGRDTLAQERDTLVRERREFDREAGAFVRRYSPLASVRDVRVTSSVQARIYRPHDARRGGPAVVFFHGGGFALGGLASHDALCRALAHDTGVVVVAVDYRLAPEHSFPSAPDDATTAFRWVAREARALEVSPERLAVAGDSAGGNLAAVVCLDTRGDAFHPCFQALLYPATDSTWSFPSMETMANGGLLTRESVGWFRSAYAPAPALWSHPRVSPYLADDLSSLPPALVQTAGFDPLRDEGEAYGERLRDAGVPVVVQRYPSLSHGFFNLLGTVTAVERPWSDLVTTLQQQLL